ncbi:DUF5133 domain-containing protein [[Kitasatospora] papulosa]|uniref:DUF5133 domain-containing protein n=1 Tax=[Kitasatospora] papulosa TaxID=1464011 RepID=UPI0036E735DD
MRMAHSAMLQNLIEPYDTLRILQAHKGAAEVQERLDDILYTLCVSTGTRDVAVARHHLPGARPQDNAPVCG